MKTKKFFNVFMIAAAICTTGFMMTSCQDEDDVMEVKYKTVKVESSEVYQTQDVVDVQITYNVVAEVSQGVERTESEWVNLIKKEINKEVNYVVKGLKFDNLSTEIFDDIYDSQNNKDYTLGVFKGVSFVKIEKKDEDKKEIEEPEIEEPEIEEPVVKMDTVLVNMTSIYKTQDNYSVKLTYDMKLWEKRETEYTDKNGVSEWTDFIKDACGKVFTENVGNVMWTKGKENFDKFMFGESGWGLSVANSFNDEIHSSDLGIDYNCTFKIDEYPAEVIWVNNNIKSNDTYSIANGKEVVIDYSVDVRMLSNVAIDEIKNLINKNITDGVKNISWSDESSFSARVKNILNNIPETDNYSLQNYKVSVEIVKNETPLYSVSIEESTLFTCRNKTYGYPECNYIWSMDWTAYSKLKVKICEIKYSDNLEIDGDAKDVLFEKVNLAVNNYIGGLVMKDLYLSSGESIDVFLDNVLIECENHIKTLFNMENDNFEIVDFEIMKGAAKNYWINSCTMYGKTSGYDYKYIYNVYAEYFYGE